ncbi:MAG TPA: S8 family serine peptidase [Bacteriovoracaceae bacterium]|nr:S8 family serine peptidase [Bacteriovoracaceae bacterium]
MRKSLVLCFLASCNFMGGGDPGPATIPLDPNLDPLAKYQWHILNTGQLNFGTEAGEVGADINLSNVHDEFTGQGITVAVSDGRIDLDHEDLEANADLANSKDYLQNSPYIGAPTSTDDEDGHGTAVSGIIAAVKGNGKGGFGLAPASKLIGLNFVISDQSVSKYVDQTRAPAQVFNYSYGSPSCMVVPAPATFLESIVFETIVNNRSYITSVGNDYSGDSADCAGTGSYFGNGNLDQSKSYPYFIVVAATSAQGLSSSYSAQSANTWISAPGGDLPSAGVLAPDLEGCAKGYAQVSTGNDFDNNTNGLNSNCSYGISSTIGTSFSSPVVSGAVAVLKSIDDFSWREIKYILAKTAKFIEPDLNGWIVNAAGFNFHNFVGFGLLDVSAAVTLAKARTFELFALKQAVDDYSGLPTYASGVLNTAIPDNNEPGITSVINVDKHNLWIEHVQLKVSVTHTKAQDVGLYLTSPSGTKTILLIANNGTVDASLVDLTLGANAFYGEKSRGNWTLQVTDRSAADTGALVKWSLKIIGNKGTSLDLTPPSAVSGLGNTGNTLSWTASAATDLLRYEACVLPGVTASCEDKDWINLGTVTTKSVNNYSSFSNELLAAGTDYVFKIRAIDSSENESTMVEHSWRTP